RRPARCASSRAAQGCASRSSSSSPRAGSPPSRRPGGAPTSCSRRRGPRRSRRGSGSSSPSRWTRSPWTTSSRSASSSSTRPRTRRGSGARRSTSPTRSSSCSATWPSTRGGSSPAPSSSTRSGATTTTAGPAPWTSTCGGCAPSSAPSTTSSSGPSATSGTGSSPGPRSTDRTCRSRCPTMKGRRRVVNAPGSNTSRHERPSRRLALQGPASPYLSPRGTVARRVGTRRPSPGAWLGWSGAFGTTAGAATHPLHLPGGRTMSLRRSVLAASAALALVGAAGCTADSVLDLQVGDCLSRSDLEGDEVSSAKAIDCAEEHDAEIYAEHTFSGDEYPGTDTVEEESQEVCTEKFEEFIGLPYLESEIYFTMLYPSEQ